eukprot:scaffold57702_cov57-Phaeocystis_antarctica.AAC.2
MVRTYTCPLINTVPHPRGVIISQPILRLLGVIFDGDHDFEGPRSPIAHPDTVLRKPVTPPGHPPSRAQRVRREGRESAPPQPNLSRPPYTKLIRSAALRLELRGERCIACCAGAIMVAPTGSTFRTVDWPGCTLRESFQAIHPQHWQQQHTL